MSKTERESEKEIQERGARNLHRSCLGPEFPHGTTNRNLITTNSDMVGL